MSLSKIYTWQLTCDNCKKTEEVKCYAESEYSVPLPEGWVKDIKYYYDCGLTGYTDEVKVHYCSDCRNLKNE